jgi:hypothetical protein
VEKYLGLEFGFYMTLLPPEILVLRGKYSSKIIIFKPTIPNLSLPIAKTECVLKLVRYGFSFRNKSYRWKETDQHFSQSFFL